ncbi:MULTISPECIES: hypothetical protein [Actinoalloteichus]|uniref:Uncharacterized protein n=1 Tax=Actinoalloteichus fjordicus TaxID=1612552 RepID=A0AAC9PV41_9PSEU|nr:MULTISPECIES: hypothetical protein [Actinoalloteichus]APU17705.1 hypothetical protein UA74_28530 [Actinoalloteichus fjordicus]APU23783.1 hypothetical protein UA75_29060 [Actinoalloteichus sp. GBA129-24]
MTSSEKQQKVDIEEFEAEFPPVQEDAAGEAGAATETEERPGRVPPRKPTPGGGIQDPVSEPGKLN